jgi:hypothetical protein
MPSAEDWRPDEADLVALGTRTRRWLSVTLAQYQLDALEGEALLHAMRSLNRIEGLEAAIGRHGLVTATGNPHPLLAALAREQRVFCSLWATARPREK